jgi:TrmH family RNA methyltransferase
LLSKSKIQLIRSLEQKKYRLQHGLFVAEGDKTVRAALASSLEVACVAALPAWIEQIPAGVRARAGEIIEVGHRELEQISFLKTPHQALALLRTPQYALDLTTLSGQLSLYLDCVQDPGNVGTIIRVADWFGIRHVLCSPGCADPFSPKAVQSTMGAILRVKTYPCDASFFGQLKSCRPDFPVYGAFLDGADIYRSPLTPEGVIVMGNESQGISDEVAQHVGRRLLIPPYPAGEPAAESLNVSTAAAVVCAEFRRRLS